MIVRQSNYPHEMLIVALGLLSVIPLSTSQKCSIKADCKSKYAPHCSKWGYCQWTNVYGTAGKAQGSGLKAGECRSHLDCNIRAPVCSEQGFCTDNGRGEKINRRPKYPVFEPWTQDDNNIDTEGAGGIPFTTTTTLRTTPRTTTTITTITRGSGLSSICSSPNGVFPHPSDCELYYQCHGGTPVLGRCQRGFRWSVKRNYCDWSENVVCDKTTKTTATITTTTTTTTKTTTTTTKTTTTTTELETLEDIYENEAVSVNQLSYGAENLIRNQRLSLTVDEPKEGPINPGSAGPVTFQSISSQPVPPDPLTPAISSQPVPQDPLPPAITSQPVPPDPTFTRAWDPRQAGFRALPAVPGKPLPYKRPVFNLYDAVPKT